MSKDKKHQKKNVFIYSHGCEMRGLDASKVSNYFKENKYKIVDDPKDADYIVFFSCAFLNTTAETSLQRIKEFQKYDAELIVAGCISEIQKKSLDEVFKGKILPTKDLNKIDEIFPNNPVKFSNIKDEHFVWKNINPFGTSTTWINLIKKSALIRKIHHIFQNTILEKFLGNIYPFFWLYEANQRRFQNPSIYQITIAKGCNFKCTYCSIAKAVGPLKSKPVEQCIKEFKEGLNKGFKSIILQADDIGTYGLDIGSSLPELLDEMTKFDGDYEIILRNTHPIGFIKNIGKLEEILKRRKINIILLSIQSGSNYILKRMKRGYTKEELIEVAERIKTAHPKLKLGCEIIIGFPGETEDDFKETIDVMDKIHLDNGMIAAFSGVKGTPAYTMEPQVSDAEVKRRMKTLKKHLRQNNYFAWYNKSYCKGIFFKEKEAKNN